tara:strand:+ start:363 stop:629 length:267 start_codon:yes stop_codon:yes gene_type:complete
MKIKALKKDWEIKDVSYKDRRELYQLNVKAFWDGKVDPDPYYEVLEKVFELSGLTEKDVEDLPMPEVDQLLQAILGAYLGLEKNADGD